MTKVKICGLMREKDILYVNKLKPDYAGFVFAESNRRIDKYKAKSLIAGLDRNIKKVGVFLNTPASEVRETARYCHLDILQFHGDEPPEYCNSFEYEVWKAFRIKDVTSLKQLGKYDVDGFLLDTSVRGQYGGTGKTFHWSVASSMDRYPFVILAGGLTPENVKKAIEIVRPVVVDVSSGVETDGYKDCEKIKKFIGNVRG